MPMLGGVLLDRYPGALGFRYFFAFIAGLSIIGFLSTLLIRGKGTNIAKNNRE